MPSRFAVEAVPIAMVAPHQWQEIWTLAERFTDTTREVFEASVREKKLVVLIRERSGARLVGMGAIDVYDVERAGRRIIVIYAGNTLFDEGVRGFSLVQRIGFQQFLAARLRHPLTPIYLFFDTYSFKSYLMLPRNFREFWPRRGASMPPEVAGLLDQLGRARYGALWDPERQLCRRTGTKKLKPWVAKITEAELADPDIRFYAEKNPGYLEGDMLAVLVPLKAANWLAVLRNALRRTRRGR